MSNKVSETLRVAADIIARSEPKQIVTEAELRREFGVPYREFCRHPDKCAGLSCCPRDPCCAD